MYGVVPTVHENAMLNFVENTGKFLGRSGKQQSENIRRKKKLSVSTSRVDTVDRRQIIISK